MMKLVELIWNSMGGFVPGAIILKLAFFLAAGGLFWTACELVKFLANLLAGITVDVFRYLTVMVRGWPEGGDPRSVKSRLERL